MGFLKKISNLFSGPSRSESPVYLVRVKCRRCGEIIQARINLYNDLSLDENEQGEAIYNCRKLLMSEAGHCFQRVEVILKFNARRKLIDREIIGGSFED